MLLLLATALIAAAPAPAATVPPDRAGDMPIFNPNAPAMGKCPPISRYEAARRGGKLMPRHLDDLPPADVYRAVYRRIGGCVAPIIVRYGLGGR
jgi:hypothetical protein